MKTTSYEYEYVSTNNDGLTSSIYIYLYKYDISRWCVTLLLVIRQEKSISSYRIIKHLSKFVQPNVICLFLEWILL